MTCSGRYAEAWEFASFWCPGNLVSRVHDGGDNQAALIDSQARFDERGVQPDVGMVLYNVTDGSSGVVTAVENTTLTATLTGGVENDWDNGDRYRLVTITAVEIAAIENFLNLTAADLHAALSAQGMCNCALSEWGLGLLKKLNIIETATFYVCGCGTPNLTDEQRQLFFEWMNTQLELLRTGKLDVCQGATGPEYPAFGVAQKATTDFAAAQIIAGRIARQRR